MALSYAKKREKLQDFMWSTKKEYYKPKVPTSLSWTYSDLGICYRTTILGKDGDAHIYLIHWEKHRPKFKQKKGKDGKTVSKRMKDGYWVMKTYRFPRDRVLSCKQHTRHFDIVLKY